jgi:hypothetical protein
MGAPGREADGAPRARGTAVSRCGRVFAGCGAVPRGRRALERLGGMGAPDGEADGAPRARGRGGQPLRPSLRGMRAGHGAVPRGRRALERLGGMGEPGREADGAASTGRGGQPLRPSLRGMRAAHGAVPTWETDLSRGFVGHSDAASIDPTPLRSSPSVRAQPSLLATRGAPARQGCSAAKRVAAIGRASTNGGRACGHDPTAEESTNPSEQAAEYPARVAAARLHASTTVRVLNPGAESFGGWRRSAAAFGGGQPRPAAANGGQSRPAAACHGGTVCGI